MDRFNFGRQPTYGSSAARPVNSLWQRFGSDGVTNPFNPFAGPPRQPAPTAQITDSEVISGDWRLPKPPTGRDALGIAAGVQSRLGGGNRSAFGPPGQIGQPGRPQPPQPPNVPDAWSLGDQIRSRVGGQMGNRPTMQANPTPIGRGAGEQFPIGGLPRQGQTGRAMPPAGLMPNNVTPFPDIRGGFNRTNTAPPQPPQPPMPVAPQVPAPPGQPVAAAQTVNPPGVQQPPVTEPTAPSSGGTLGSYGNQSVDQWDDAFIAAGAKHGVDPTLLKAMMEIESGGDGNLPLDQCRSDGSCGPMQVKPEYWGQSASVPDQIDKAAAILGDAVASGQYATPEDALFGIYFPTDDVMNGTTQGGYRDTVHSLQGQMGASTPAASGEVAQGADGTVTDGVTTRIPPGTITEPVNASHTGTTNETGNALVDVAISYEGQVPYPSTWAGNPGKGEDPMTYGGWDCSGFTYWLDQNYGDGTLAQGSHYQYQQAVDNGQLTTDTSQLQPGDLVFFDTGLRSGAGAELNGASHVGVYIGDGRFIHSANPNDGTIISNLDEYMGMYPYLGSSDIMINPAY